MRSKVEVREDYPLDANPTACFFEIHQLLQITPRMFKHDLE